MSVKTATALDRRWLVVIGLLAILGMGIAVAIDARYPNLYGALWTRLHYSSSSPVVELDQYRDRVPIRSSGQLPVRELDDPPRTYGSPAGQALMSLVRRTRSNVVVLGLDGEIRFEAYAATAGAGPEMLTNSMSMAKSLVAMLVGVAIEQGAIRSVDQPLGELLKEFEDDARGKISVRNLLQMESGLESQHAGFPLSHLQAMYFGEQPDLQALGVRAVGPPGETFEYNSVNTQLLLIVLQRRMAADFETLLSRYVWTPLQLAPGFGWRAGPKGGAKGFCCIFATARSWAEIGRNTLATLADDPARARIVSRDWLQQSLRESQPGSRYGYQIRIASFGESKIPFAHFDGTPQQFAYLFPTLGIVMVRVGESSPQFGGTEFLSAVFRFLGEAPS